MANVLDIRRLDVIANSVTLLKDINLTLKPGEILAVIGANGAGKTTLFNSITGDVAITHGNIMLCDKQNNEWTLEDKAKHLAVLPQLSLLNFPYKVAEVVGLGRIPHSTGRDIDQQTIHQAMVMMDIAHLAKRDYTQLSGGEKQRTQLARVMAQVWRREDAHSRLLLLDEPSAALDLGHVQQLMKAVVSFAEQGVGVAMVVHDVNIAAKYAHSILALDRGHIAAYGSVQSVLTKPLLERLYGAHVCISQHPHTQKTIVLT
ncbi:heme ABC transporter ATP-binding protein [Agarilytica rhodophyticola]|uniref:heme ABC transporter ATP-binding protein n=1 Tax=Agarilytica rhodophyticola TaxID=1737490 RepID=UPI000B347A4C|nr:heme ABC transporter ATP-binding protein [Agarilytica rhodophyticola]